MKRAILRSVIFGFVMVGSPWGEAQEAVTPMDAPLAEGESTLIACELKEDTAAPPAEAKAGKGIYHYKLFLPEGYASHPERRYPVLFVMMPGGNAGMKMDLKRAREEGWIGVMLVEAKNGPWEPILGNMLAAHADVVQRVRVKEGLKFATGFSGGARGSAMLSQICPGFSGVLLQGAAFPAQDNGSYITQGLKSKPYSVFMTMGDQDSNFKEIESLQRALPGEVPFKAVTFAGGHTGAGPELMDQGLDWLLVQTLGRGDFSAEAPVLFASMSARALTLPDTALKMEQLTLLVELGKKLGASAAGKMPALEQALQTIKQNPEMDKLQKAEAALHEAREKEAKELKEMEGEKNDKKLARSEKKLGDMYEKLALEFPGTPAGDEAKKKVDQYLNRRR